MKFNAKDCMREVVLADLEMNPYRNLKENPLDESKVGELKDAIEGSFFWPQLIGREHNGKIQIAFGHHRHEAGMRLKIKKIWMTVIPLSEGQMCDYLTRENIGNNTDARTINNAILETKKLWDALVKKYTYKEILAGEISAKKLFKNANAYKIVKRKGGVGRETLVAILPKFYTPYKIKTALQVLKAIKTLSVSKEAVNILEAQTQQKEFIAAVKHYETPKGSQKRIAKEIIHNEIGVRDIPAHVRINTPSYVEKIQKLEPKKLPMLDEFIEDISADMSSVYTDLLKVKDCLDSIQSSIVKEEFENNGKELLTEMKLIFERK